MFNVNIMKANMAYDFYRMPEKQGLCYVCEHMQIGNHTVCGWSKRECENIQMCNNFKPIA